MQTSVSYNSKLRQVIILITPISGTKYATSLIYMIHLTEPAYYLYSIQGCNAQKRYGIPVKIREDTKLCNKGGKNRFY